MITLANEARTTASQLARHYNADVEKWRALLPEGDRIHYAVTVGERAACFDDYDGVLWVSFLDGNQESYWGRHDLAMAYDLAIRWLDCVW